MNFVPAPLVIRSDNAVQRIRPTMTCSYSSRGISRSVAFIILKNPPPITLLAIHNPLHIERAKEIIPGAFPESLSLRGQYGTTVLHRKRLKTTIFCFLCIYSVVVHASGTSYTSE